MEKDDAVMVVMAILYQMSTAMKVEIEDRENHVKVMEALGMAVTALITSDPVKTADAEPVKQVDAKGILSLMKGGKKI